jgi:uncharacterized Tic20 family protein
MTLFEKMPGITAQKKDSKTIGALAYLPVAGLIVPAIIYIVSKEDKYVKFHALNALGFQLGLTVLATVFGILMFVFQIASMLLGLVTFGASAFITSIIFFLIWIFAILFIGVFFFISLYFMYLAYEGKAFQIPYITEFVMKHAWNSA